MLAELDRHPHARAVLDAGPAARRGTVARVSLPRAGRLGQARGRPSRGRGAAGRRRAGSCRRAGAGGERRASRPDLGVAERRARDPRQRHRQAGDRRRQQDAIRVRAPGVRDRAGGRARRRGGQPDAQDARGARLVRPPHPAHRPAGRCAGDDPLALPARALRCPAARPWWPTSSSAIWGWSRREAASCARLSLGDAEQARELAGEGGRQLRAAAAAFVGAVIAGQAASEQAVGGAAGGGQGPRRGGPRRARGPRPGRARAVSAQGAEAASRPSGTTASGGCGAGWRPRRSISGSGS